MSVSGNSPFGPHADRRLDAKRVLDEGDLSYQGKRFVRVYWNVGNAAPYYWSFDFGDSSTERYIRAFISEVPLRSNQTGRKEAWPSPSGWFESEGYVRIKNGVLYLLKESAVSLPRVA